MIAGRIIRRRLRLELLKTVRLKRASEIRYCRVPCDETEALAAKPQLPAL